MKLFDMTFNAPQSLLPSRHFLLNLILLVSLIIVNYQSYKHYISQKCLDMQLLTKSLKICKIDNHFKLFTCKIQNHIIIINFICMLNIRELQRLKGSKYPSQHSPSPLKYNNPENNHQLYDQNYEQASHQLHVNKISFNGAGTIRDTASKLLHKRGISHGQVEIPERRTFNLMLNPKLSIYNFTMKLDLGDNLRESIKNDAYSAPNTERKVRNNYVVSKQHQTIKKPTILPINSYSKTDQINKNNFEILLPIGKGGFGKVWKVIDKRSKKIYAMKLMSKIKIINKKSVGSVMNERNYLAQLHHPFLINMAYAFQDRQNLYLVMDYLDGGDLRFHLGNRQYFNQKQTKFFLSNIILALEYLHHHKIIHRDLKPQNLVFDSNGYLRLTDLGISRLMRQDNHQDTSGTPGYMAPEVMVRRSHSFAVDYFALGVIAYELMLGRRPYVGSNRKEIKDQILARQAVVKLDQLPFKWSPFSLDFINKLLLRNPDQRLGSNGIQEIKQHPWLADIQWDKLYHRKIKSPFRPISIEEDYDNYKDQISEDTINQENEDEICLLLRKNETQQLFEGYYYDRSKGDVFQKKNTSNPTNYTQQNYGRR